MKMPKREFTAEFRELAVTPDARFGQSVLACHAEITRRHEGKAGVVKRSTTLGIDSESIPAEISYKPEIRCALRLLTYPTNAGSMPFPVGIDFSTNMTVAPVVAGDGRHQGVLR